MIDFLPMCKILTTTEANKIHNYSNNFNGKTVQITKANVKDAFSYIHSLIKLSKQTAWYVSKAVAKLDKLTDDSIYNTYHSPRIDKNVAGKCSARRLSNPVEEALFDRDEERSAGREILVSKIFPFLKLHCWLNETIDELFDEDNAVREVLLAVLNCNQTYSGIEINELLYSIDLSALLGEDLESDCEINRKNTFNRKVRGLMIGKEIKFLSLEDYELEAFKEATLPRKDFYTDGAVSSRVKTAFDRVLDFETREDYISMLHDAKKDSRPVPDEAACIVHQGESWDAMQDEFLPDFERLVDTYVDAATEKAINRVLDSLDEALC